MSMADAPLALTRAYDAWLGAAIPLDTAELDRKHAEMAAHSYRFLRGSYYLWLDRIATGLPETLQRTAVPLVGDLHVENFGTWRDRDQVRRWGVNDLDELAHGPWLLDLLRLAVSAVLAPRITLDARKVARVVLDGWRDAEPGPARELGRKSNAHLAALVPRSTDRTRFYADLASGSPATPPPAVARAAASTVPPGWDPGWHEHRAGTGSLGHRRLVGVGPARDGHQHAREAKELGPGTAVWVRKRHPHPDLPSVQTRLYPEVLRAVRGPAAATRIDGWQVRDLAPDVLRIELTGLPGRDAVDVLAAMAGAAADVHGTDPAAYQEARGEADVLRHREFRELVDEMAARTQADHEAFRSALGDRFGATRLAP
jgi:hypothetical protein